MLESKNKSRRYNNLVEKVENWRQYIWRKLIGFPPVFIFKIKNFGPVSVPKDMMGPFRENFLDEIYFKYLPEGSLPKNEEIIIVDIGANVGYFSMAALCKYPKAIIYAFEPHPYCFRVLEENQQSIGNESWKILNDAVSDKNGELTINTDSTEHFSTVASVFDRKPDSTTFHAKAIRLDTFVKENGIDKIDLLKVDCEGAEYSILYTLDPSQFEIIHTMAIETHKGEGEDQNIQALEKYVKGLGYEILSLDEGYTGYIWAWKNKQ